MIKMNSPFSIAVLLLGFIASIPAVAQELPLEPLPEDIAAAFDETLVEIEEQRAEVAVLDARVAPGEGMMAEVMAARRDIHWTAMVKKTVELARKVAEQRDMNRDVSAYWDPMIEELSRLPDEIREALDRIGTETLVPSSDLELKEFVIADQKLFLASVRGRTISGQAISICGDTQKLA